MVTQPIPINNNCLINTIDSEQILNIHVSQLRIFAPRNSTMSNQVIHIHGARVHNLKNVDVKIQHGKLTVITGLSGSGKSSLAFDTLYAEGQRRYIESLSSYARQFLGKLDKPDVDYIKGIAPAIAIEQKVISSNPRSTVGTITEIYDYMKLLFARAGRTYSPISGNEVKKHTINDVIEHCLHLPKGERLLILAPISFEKYGLERQLKLLSEQGYVRLFHNNEVVNIEDLDVKNPKSAEVFLVVDRYAIPEEWDDAQSGRLSDSVQLAFLEGHGEMLLFSTKDERLTSFSTRFELDGMSFVEPSVHFFTFNNPFGACKKCEGYGSILGIDESLVIPEKNMSVWEGAVVPWRTDSMKTWMKDFVQKAKKHKFPIHRPITDLTEDEYDMLWNGRGDMEGINQFFEFIETQAYKIQYRVMLSRYRGKTTCPDCKGTRLRKDASYVKIGGKSLQELVLMPITDLKNFFDNLELNQFDQQVVKRLLPEIKNRLNFLNQVGVGYLTLNRQSNSLSGGESQRINLATSLGSSLVGSMYILDEPSIGLHPRDTEKLIDVLQGLKKLGNSVIVVEHEEDIMRAADEIIDMGPEAGRFGGEVVFQGNHNALLKEKVSLTAQYLNGDLSIPVPKNIRPSKDAIVLHKAKLHNLKGMDVRFPLNQLVCVTGVSGSGKSSLVKGLLYPLLQKHLGILTGTRQTTKQLSGDWERISDVQLIDQNPIGKSSRSNPVTYLKAFDDIREIMASQKLAKVRGYKPGYFSFNVPGGRCENCEGEGEITVSMQFMADVHLTCEHCKGTRYKPETLEVLYREKNVADILDMSIDEAVLFFGEGQSKSEEKVVMKLKTLQKVGLGYVKLGQSASTLSGGEAQRVKLAFFLTKGATSQKCLFIFDEPTTGLHFHDINKLIVAFNELIALGHSIIVIEHNLDVVKCADHVIDIGPEGGELGGYVLFEGTPQELTKCEKSYTGKYLAETLKKMVVQANV
jgi:excinuclease ABC subunit A